MSQSSQPAPANCLRYEWDDAVEDIVVPVDSFIFGISRPGEILSDEIITTFGVPVASLRQCIDGGLIRSAVMKRAMKNGLATSSTENPLTGTAGHVLSIVQQELSVNGPQWWLAASRKRQAFSQSECHLIQTQLCQWQCRYLQAGPSQESRMLLGQDRRVITADLLTRQNFITRASSFDELFDTVFEIIRQRYPDFVAGKVKFLIVQWDKRPAWVWIRQDHPVSKYDKAQWRLEVRPADFDQAPTVGVVDDERVALALGFIHDHFNELPSLKQIAKHVHISPFHFHRQFTKSTGVTPKQYTLKIQLLVASWLLQTRQLAMQEIADYTGFSSQSHFTTAFSSVFGITPSEFGARSASGRM